ncbi:reticulophagy regulator 3-like isoform X4 [Amblyomma americanum]
MAAAQKRVLELLAWSRELVRSGFEKQFSTVHRSEDERDTLLLRVLGPFEAHLVSLQSLLIWERPYVSAAAFVAVNCLFWLVVSCSRRFYSFVALVAAVVFMYKTWVDSIWPEIRVPPPEGEDNELWTPIHPQVFSVPELSRYITDWSGSVRKWIGNVVLLRKTNPGLFCILASSTFAMTAVLGRMVSGVLILYGLLMTVTLGPGIVLYVIPATWYEQADALMRIASGKPPRRKPRNEETQFCEGMGSMPDYDEETDLDSFLPDMTTMPSLSEVCDSEDVPSTAATTTVSPPAPMHFASSHFRQESSDSEADEALIRGLTSRRPVRQPEASKSRPLAVGPRTSRHSSQGSDIDIDEYEVVDKRELSHS